MPDLPSAEPTRVEVQDDPVAHRYLATIGGAEAGAVYYERNGGQLTLTHTDVSPDFGGHGVGGALAKVALDNARTESLTVVPQCPFVAHYIAKHTDYLELVPADLRDRVARA